MSTETTAARNEGPVGTPGPIDTLQPGDDLMGDDSGPVRPNTPRRPSHYAERADEGDITWLEDAVADFLGMVVTEAQREICRSVASFQYTLVVTANGLGKSYVLAAITNIWLLCRYPATAFATSGTGKKMRRTFCKPVEAMHDNALDGAGLPGTYKHAPERIEIEGEPEHYFEAASPGDAGELEGVHNAYTLGIIEEADKDAIDEEVIDAMRSLVTDHRDRLIAIANPPEDAANSISPLMDPGSDWHMAQFSSFDSHNVQVELGRVEGPMIDGLATLGTIKSSWQQYHNQPWPGVEDAKAGNVEGRLDARWYRRRMGEVPPGDAGEYRPFDPPTVEAAFNRFPPEALQSRTPAFPEGLAADVARKGGDSFVVGGVFGPELRILDRWELEDYNYSEAHVKDLMQDGWSCQFAIDANGEGSGFPDRVKRWYPNVQRFKSDVNAVETHRFKDQWTASLFYLGQFLRNGGHFSNRRLRKELLAAAYTVKFEEKGYQSRDAQVLKATPKKEVKERLGRSPDMLDTAAMAVWAAEEATTLDMTRPQVSSTWAGQQY